MHEEFWYWLSLHIQWKNEQVFYWWQRYEEEISERRLKETIGSIEQFMGLLLLKGFKVTQKGDVWVFRPKRGNTLIPKEKRLIIR